MIPRPRQPFPLTRWGKPSPVAAGVSEGTADLHPEPLVLPPQLDFQQDDHVEFLRSKGHDKDGYHFSFFLEAYSFLSLTYASFLNLCFSFVKSIIRTITIQHHSYQDLVH